MCHRRIRLRWVNNQRKRKARPDQANSTGRKSGVVEEHHSTPGNINIAPTHIDLSLHLLRFFCYSRQEAETMALPRSSAVTFSTVVLKRNFCKESNRGCGVNCH
jgi:hypothetical protein